MKVYVLNGKKVGISMMVIGLMLILFASVILFHNNFMSTVLLQNGVTSLKQYVVCDGKFSYNLPDSWRSNEINPIGSFKYCSNFTSMDKKVTGNIYVINYSSQLKSLVESDADKLKKAGTDCSFDSFEMGDKEGYEISYIQRQNNKCFKTYKYYFSNNGNVVAYAFRIQDKDFYEGMPALFKTLSVRFRINI